MTGQDKITEVIDQVTEIKNNIQKKYDKVLGKIAECQVQLDEVIKNAQKNSEIWVNKQKKKITKKINDFKKKIEDWLKDQLDKVQKWMDGVKQDLMDFIAELLKSKALALTGI